MKHSSFAAIARLALLLILAAAAASATTAGTDPWSTAAANMRTLFTGAIVTGLSVVCVVIAGLTLAFGEGSNKKQVAGVVFGLGMALAAVPFLDWVTPTATTVGASTIPGLEIVALETDMGPADLAPGASGG